MSLHTIVIALFEVFRQKIYPFLFLIFSILLFLLFIYIPVKTIPGNDFIFQLSLLRPTDILLLLALSLLTGLSLVMNLYLLRRKSKTHIGVSLAGQGGVGIVSGIVASVFGTATCAACVATFFGFLGVGGVLFLVQYRTIITLFAIGLLFISIYFTSQKVHGICTVCRS